MAQQYTKTELHAIAQTCSKKLPPASAVQAMFLYELQRETEMEKLFDGQLFRLVQAEKGNDYLKSVVENQEKQMELQESKLLSKVQDLDKIINLASHRIESLQSELRTQTALLKAHDNRLKVLDTAQTVQSPPTAQYFEYVKRHATDLHSIREEFKASQDAISTLDNHIGILFDERDAFVKQLIEAKKRIDDLSITTQDSRSKTDERIAQIENTTRGNNSEHKSRFANLERTHVETVGETNERVTALQQTEAQHHKDLSTRLTEVERSSVSRVHEVEEEVRSLRDLFCSFARQNAPVGAAQVANLTQRLPIMSANGQCLHLAVPKGSAFVGLKENRKPDSHHF